MLETFNNFYINLQFTCEHEENNCFNIFGSIIRDTTNKLKTKRCTKLTNLGTYLNYNSNHPEKE